MQREEKIKLLKGLCSGDITIEDITPKHLRMELGRDGYCVCYINNVEVSPEEHSAQYNKQRDDQGNPLSFMHPLNDIIIDGINMKSPEYCDIISATVTDEHPEYFFNNRKSNPTFSIPSYVRFCKNPDILKYVAENKVQVEHRLKIDVEI